MTVGELIEELRKHDAGKDVRVSNTMGAGQWLLISRVRLEGSYVIVDFDGDDLDYRQED